MVYSVGKVFAESVQNNSNKEFNRILKFAEINNLNVQPKAHSIVLTPQADKRIALISLWPTATDAKIGTILVEIIISASKSGERWNTFMGISPIELKTTLMPSFSYEKYRYIKSDYEVLRKIVDSHNIDETVELLNSLLKKTRSGS